jgi:hypothetical protein
MMSKMQPGAYMLTCVGINTYTHYEGHEVPCHGPNSGRGPFKGSLEAPSHPGTEQIRYVTGPEVAELCHVRDTDIQGLHEGMNISVTFTESEYLVDELIDGNRIQKTAGFYELKTAEPNAFNLVLENDSSIPKNCEVKPRENPGTPESRLNLMKLFLKDSLKQRDFDGFNDIIANINIERSRIAFATNILTIFAKCRTQLYEIIADLER